MRACPQSTTRTRPVRTKPTGDSPRLGSQSPIAMGAHGPELLRYELVRSALRDPRMCVPEGLGLEAQGITSGPLWDRATSTILSINGEDHTRLRRLVSKAFTPRSVGRLDTTITEIITELTDPLVAAGRCEVVEDIARPYPVPVIAELLGAPREDAKLFSAWADDFFKTLHAGMSSNTSRRS